MFGTLKPRLCVLQPDARAAYDRYYCGLCKGLGDHYGQLTRGLLSQDAVFMALLVDALAVSAAEESSCRCPLMPVVHRPTVDPASVAMRYASAVQMLLGDQLLADRAMDGRRAYASARRWIAGHVTVARATLTELGLDTGALEGFEHRQARRESTGASPDEAAAPTAEALAHVFAALADLPGMPDAVRAPAARASLRELGASVGRAIYLRDALEDLRDDLIAGAFNPCVTPDASGAREVSPARVEEAATGLLREVDGFRAKLDALPLVRHAVVLKNILCGEFRAKSVAAVASARRDADEVVRALWASAARRSRFDRALVRVALAAFMAWAWVLKTTVAFARPRKVDAGVPHDRALPDLNPGGSDAGTTPWFDAGEYNPSPWGDGGPPAPRGGGGPRGACGDTCDGCVRTAGCERTCQRACNSCCDGVCKECHCGDACQGVCRDVTKPCGDCGKSCDSCGKPCGDCCKPCNDCGHCCNDCGSGCQGCGNSCNHCCR
jgi:hypothetical protein